MRPLFINDEIKVQVKELVDWASSDYYHPGKSETIPGDDSRHVIVLPVGFRCVFSFTVDPPGGVWRHLSISVPQQDKYPNPIAAFTIAALFGFTGYDPDHPGTEPPTDWLLAQNKQDHCIVLAQPL